MKKNQKEDLIIDVLHDLRNAIDECIDQMDSGHSNAKSTDCIIDTVETEFHKLNLKTNEIYSEMISKVLEEKEDKEAVESKKANTSERV